MRRVGNTPSCKQLKHEVWLGINGNGYEKGMVLEAD